MEKDGRMQAETTLRYYDSNAQSFAADTIDVDMSSIQDAFLSLLHSGARILDLGCGTGRDSRYFLSRGFAVTACDGSARMCEVASANTGLEVRHLLFEDLDYVDEFDGIWACSSMLHVPSTGLKDIFRLVHRALKSNGVFYCSFKYGTYEGERDGRYFTDLTEDSIAELMDGRFQSRRIWITNDARPDRHDEKWLNVMARKL